MKRTVMGVYGIPLPADHEFARRWPIGMIVDYSFVTGDDDDPLVTVRGQVVGWSATRGDIDGLWVSPHLGHAEHARVPESSVVPLGVEAEAHPVKMEGE